MYEVWLMMNIVWEWSLARWPMMLALLLLLAGWAAVGLFRLVSAHGVRWPATALAAVAGFVVGLWLWPALVGSSVSEMRYVVDWMIGLGMAGATAVVTVVLVLPWLGRRSG